MSVVTSINSDQEDVLLVAPDRGTSQRSSCGTVYKTLDGEDFERLEVHTGI